MSVCIGGCVCVYINMVYRHAYINKEANAHGRAYVFAFFKNNIRVE